LIKCKEVAILAGISAKAFLHKFRAAYATILIRNKTPMESIKELLGHSSIVETEKANANNDSSNMHREVSVLYQYIK
jgi:site-specific recombinase XerD